MSNLTTEVFGDMNYLYEHIANRDAQQLNENSDYYDDEASEIVEDILATISSSMVYEGYSANAIITFLATSSEQDIIEKYLSFDENILAESTVSEDYIVEQLEIFDFAISEGLGSLIGKVAKGAFSLAGRVASKPARMKAAERLATSNNPTRTAAAYQKLANKNTTKAGFKVNSTDGSPASVRFKNTGDAARAASMMKATAKVKDIAKGAKAALPTIGKVAAIGAGVAGVGALSGAVGAKMAGAGSGQGPAPSGAKTTNASNADFTKGSALAKLGGREGRIKDGEFRTMGWSQQSKDRYNKAKGSATPPPAPKLPAPAGSGAGKPAGGGKTSTPAKSTATAKPKGSADDQWAAANPKLAAAKAERDRTRGTSATTNPMMKDMKAGLPAPSSPSASTAMTGFDLAKKGIDLSKKNTQQKQTVSSSYEYDAYNLVLEYLFDYGHADTVEEAEYIMTELDESFIQSLVETYEANVLAEEVTEWVNELVEEGHDLSEYTWDDMVDYYFSEGKGDGNLENNYPPYDKVTRGDIISGALGQDQMGGKNKSKKSKKG
jgi:hypothetical protein